MPIVTNAWGEQNQDDPNRPLLPLPPANRQPGFQNPGANLPFLQGLPPTIGPPIAGGEPIPGVSDQQRQQILQSAPPPPDGLPAPQFSAPGPTPNMPTIQPGQLNALVRGGGQTSGGTGEIPPPPSPGIRPTPMPSIFNAGVQSAPDVAIPFNGGATPAGYRQAIMDGGGPGFLQQILPSEQGPGGQDLRRQGLSLAEIQQANPHLDMLGAYHLQQRLQAQSAADQMRTAGLRTDQRNIGQGLMDNPTRMAVAQAGPNPAAPGGGGTLQREVARGEAETAHRTGGGALRDTIVGGIIGQGGTAGDVAEALASAGLPAVGAGQPGTTPVSAPVAAGGSQLHRTLDQHLQTAAGLPAQPRGSRIPVALQASTTPQEAVAPITNFVHSIASAGLLTPESLPEVMAYMTQRFGAHRVDPWFQARFGGLLSGGVGSPHHGAVQTMQDAMRGAGVAIGNTGRVGDDTVLRNPLGLGSVGQSIRNGIQSLFGG